MPPVCNLSCGRKHMIIQTVDGRVMTCGNDSYGQLGVGLVGAVLKSSTFSLDVSQNLIENLFITLSCVINSVCPEFV